MKPEIAPDIDTYIAGFPKDIQKLLKQMRTTIKKAAPNATEAMAYGLPTFRLEGNLVHFGGFKTHIGFYPAPTGIQAFEKELAPYMAGKGTLQFPLDKPLPLDLVTRITQFRAQENLKKAALKKKPKAKK